MPRYKYLCPTCNFEYIEIRDIDDPQTFTKHACGTDYQEIND